MTWNLLRLAVMFLLNLRFLVNISQQNAQNAWKSSDYWILLTSKLHTEHKHKQYSAFDVTAQRFSCSQTCIQSEIHIFSLTLIGLYPWAIPSPHFSVWTVLSLSRHNRIHRLREALVIFANDAWYKHNIVFVCRAFSSSKLLLHFSTDSQDIV